MISSEQKFHKKEIAAAQLETAVRLFLNHKDLSSVITLAGAASNILSQLVKNAGKEPFVEYACRVCNYHSGKTPPRQKYNHHIDKILGISTHKQMSF